MPGRAALLFLCLLLAATAGAQPPGVTVNGPLPGPLPLFPPDNWWNRDITGAPVDARSQAFINWIQTSGRRRLHPDWGGDTGLSAPEGLTYGMSYVVVPGTQPLVPVLFEYDEESDPGAPGRPAGYPIPPEAKTQPRWIEGGLPGGGNNGDRHMLIVDRDNRYLFELFATRWNASANRWEAGSGAVFKLDSNARRPEGWTSADAAGLAILPGLVRYDEVFGPDPIRHALRFTVRATNGYVFPASHRAGSNSSAPPMGARFRLKPGTDLTRFPAHIRKIFQAMKTYGLIVADNGSDMYIQGTYDTRWNMDEMLAAFRSLYADDFEVIQLGWNPALPPTPPSNDEDRDGLPDDWERQFGLSASAATGMDGPDGDPDGDGRTNVQEYQAGTHPRGFVTRYFAEGATGTFFDTRIALLNAATTPATILLRFLRADGSQLNHRVVVAPTSRVTVSPKTIQGLEGAEFSTVVESDVAFVADRLMRWDGSGYGSHAEHAIQKPASTWYFGEGATHSSFDLFYLVQNPNDVAAPIEVRYLRPAPAAPILKNYIVPARSRFTIWVNREGAALQNVDVSAVVRSTTGLGIIAERAMYRSAGGVTFAAGHESAGVTAPATFWFFAEGATGAYFDLFMLLANPGDIAAQVEATYLLASGRTVVKNYTILPQSRTSVWVDREDSLLADAAVSTTLRSVNATPIVAERSMWWPGSVDTWFEGHNSPGTTESGRRWGLAEGEDGGPSNTETYVLVANVAAATAAVTVTLTYEGGGTDSRTFSVPATSRFNVAVRSEFPAASGRRFGIIVDSTMPIVVERAMYSDAGNVRWAAGSNATAVRLD